MTVRAAIKQLLSDKTAEYGGEAALTLALKDAVLLLADEIDALKTPEK